ncbi:hypothetical protein [Caedibacter taeniospiralis]|uniref:hypothetical protein n=1 Tax=Caedibacter taeniospiralis TaxID=28907 RepID=UPI000C26DF0F|nr:hypothetical protein [Caedibacter taeniospiralis]
MIKGYGFGFLYVFLVAASTIWLNSLGQGITIPILLFYTSLTSILIFNLVNINRFKQNHALILSSKKNWLYMSICLIFVWYFTYYATIHSSAEFFIATAFLTAAFISSGLAKKYFKTLACVFSLGLVYFYSSIDSPITLGTAMLAGAATYAYYRSSYQFSQETKMSALAILSIRFYLVLLFAVLYIVASGELIHLKISIDEIAVIVLFALVNMVMPAYLSQTSLHAIGVSKFTFLNTLIPALTFFLDAIFNHTWHIQMLVACLCATLTLNVDQWGRAFSARQQRQ